jgi:hypothetical protein
LNTSNWKGSEAKAAKLFPGGRRRTRVGGGTYALVADDVIWLFREKTIPGKNPRVVKKTIHAADPIPPLYIEVKKRASSQMVTTFRQSEKKYFTDSHDRLVLVTHVKGERRQFVMMDDTFFHELLLSWCRERGLCVKEMASENDSSIIT